MPADGCSVVARMPRYAPAPSGIRSESRIPATGQNGSPRHVLALFDSSSRRRIECRSGLLIRGFGVQIPGGAPVLSRHYMCLLLLFSGVVGPGWVRCGTSPKPNATDPLFGFIAHAGGPAVALGERYPGSSDRLDKDGLPHAAARRIARCFGQAAATTALGRAVGLRILPPPGGRLPARRTSRATASAADNASSTATLI